ncbi:GNAT family N-acetyltransferase [Ulvibacter litoralis]|uniref:Protein N-acetyltransferase, RimJ/RimL family n=1 Tax=Ulvibacter litoralis TaxID=227084 RepID=A0A1G7I1S8_9FLAO|nr:GNAT family N-acetyltransferase [Ulvibacter litoralis]GHC62852.1 N-acetyltransferase [Ulvibacter litoralis]SDF06329.1 Protein N-acetyltransferase, RimJ/RimL family [Ulvibacter litoralis]
MSIITTERLHIREMTLEDAPVIYELVNTPEWHKFIGDRGINSVEEAETYIQESYLKSYEIHGFGAYMMVRKEDGAVLGSCGLYKRDALPHPDIGFAMFSKYAKKGYAFEAASAVLNYALHTLNIATIQAITAKYNKSSIALLEKIGLKQSGLVTLEGDDEELYLFSN